MGLKGIVLAGGTGSRLFMLTKVENKRLFTVGLAPMIWHPIWKLKQGGMDEILIVTGADHMGDAVDRRLGRSEGASRKLLTFVKDRAGHDRRYTIDSAKLQRDLGWKRA